MKDLKQLPGRVIRVYDPPRPIEEGYRDFDATKVEFNADGTMTLTHIENLGEQLDVQSGRRMDAYKHTLLAVIDVDGHIRAESIDLTEPAGSALD